MSTSLQLDSSAQRRCRHRDYVLEYISVAGRCPECGQPFDLVDPDTYVARPAMGVLQFWWPGLATAVIVAAVVRCTANTNPSISAAVAGGCSLVGYRFRYARWMNWPIIVSLAAGSVIIGFKLRSGAYGYGFGFGFTAILIMGAALCFLIGVIVRAILQKMQSDRSNFSR